MKYITLCAIIIKNYPSLLVSKQVKQKTMYTETAKVTNDQHGTQVTDR